MITAFTAASGTWHDLALSALGFLAGVGAKTLTDRMCEWRFKKER